MRFLEIPIPARSELSEEIFKFFSSHKASLTKEELYTAVKEHRLYFENQPVGFFPFKVHRKGKAHLYLDLEGWKLSKKDILFEDRWLIVINKPEGLPSQSSLKVLQDHAYSAVKCLLRERKPFKSPPLFLMHRLDMDTSGVLLLSKKSSINKGIQDLFEKKTLQKTYLALSSVETNCVPLTKVVSYLARKPDKKHKFKFASFPKDHKGARRAETHFKLLEKSNGEFLYQVEPKTGRSHQIRVHMSENGFPIKGDIFYCGEKASHLYLHAQSLKFKHPITDEDVLIEAPLPSYWAEKP